MTAPIQKLVIPAAYKKLGARQGFQVTDPHDLRMIVEALPGRGKTQFLMSAPGQLVLDFDLACSNAVHSQSASIPIRTYDDYAKVKAQLIADKDARPFRRIAFDTVDRFLHLLDQHLVGPVNERREDKKAAPLNSILEFGEKGAGYTRLTNALIRELADLEQAGYSYLLSCHMRIRREIVGDTVLTERRSVMPPTMMEALVSLVDIKCRLHRSMDQITEDGPAKAIVTPDGRRLIQPTVVRRWDRRYWLGVMPTTPEEERDDDTKRRVPVLEGIIEIPLRDGWGAFVKAYAEAAAKAAAKEEGPTKAAPSDPANSNESMPEVPAKP